MSRHHHGHRRHHHDDISNGRPVRHNRLYRNRDKGMVSGLCAGVADYFGVDTWVVRVPTVIGAIMFTLPVVFGYILGSWLINNAPEKTYDTPEDKNFWRDVRTDPSATLSRLRHRFREIERKLRKLEAHVTSREFRLKREIDDL